ncbi:ribonuclease H-like domain-containing protein [Schizophyllum fasciatum]
MRRRLGKVLALFLPALTRWTSHYLSTARLLLLETEFKQLLLDSREELVLVAGDTPAARDAAEEVLAIIEAPDFWLNLKKVKLHLQPLAIAANVTQSDHARLDTVLLTLANLYRVFSDPSLDPSICTAVHKSLEKRWKKIDQDIFILAVIFNPYIRTACFPSTSPFCRPGRIRQLVNKCYKRIFNTTVEPNIEFTSALTDYLNGVGSWSAESMDLAGHKARARRQEKPLNLIVIWREWDAVQNAPMTTSATPTVGPGPTPPNGVSGMARLAMTLLSVVPNSASVERIFSLFGIIHSKHRNRQSPEKVRKAALLRQDTLTRFGRPSNRCKRHFSDIQDDDLQPGMPFDPLREHAGDPCHHTSTPSTASQDFTRLARGLTGDATDEDRRDAEERALAQGLAQRDAVHEGREINDLPEGEARLLRNLFSYPHPSDGISYSYTVLEEFWTAGKDGMEAEVSYNEAEAADPPV